MNYRELTAQLAPIRGTGEARAIVRMVMEERFGLSQADLLLGKDTTLSADDRTEFEKIAFRLLQGEPVQYVLGYTDFCGHRFHTTPDVLIPRPETEELTRLVMEWSLSAPHSPCILDLCTGSGCIAITLALANPTAKVFGVDISSKALTLARKNAVTLGAMNTEFIQQDILEDSDLRMTHAECYQHVSILNYKFTVITANPPYIRTSESAEMEPTVLEHEPHLALFVPDNDPLCFYRAIASIAQEVLLNDGRLYVEINASLSEETRQLFLSSGFCNITLYNDQFGHPRILCVRR